MIKPCDDCSGMFGNCDSCLLESIGRLYAALQVTHKPSPKTGEGASVDEAIAMIRKFHGETGEKADCIHCKKDSPFYVGWPAKERDCYTKSETLAKTGRLTRWIQSVSDHCDSLHKALDASQDETDTVHGELRLHMHNDREFKKDLIKWLWCLCSGKDKAGRKGLDAIESKYLQ